MKFSELITELEELAYLGYYTRSKISWWLMKYEKRYIGLSKNRDILNLEFPEVNLRDSKHFIKEMLFIELYEYLERAESITNEKIDLSSIIKKTKKHYGNNRKIKTNK